MATIPKFSQTSIEQISKILADAMTHTELGSLLAEAGIDEAGGGPKWERLKLALMSRQQADDCANNAVNFIRIALNPARFTGRGGEQREHINAVNVQLAFRGLQLTEQMTFQPITVAKSLSEAESRASELRRKCIERNIHEGILKYCRKEYLEKNFFHCVLEASKGLFEEIRQKSGVLESDGGKLIDSAILGKAPKLALNRLVSVEECAEQSGFGNLLKGIYGLYRTPSAHSPRLTWSVNEQEALDALTIISYARRRIDEAIKIS